MVNRVVKFCGSRGTICNCYLIIYKRNQPLEAQILNKIYYNYLLYLFNIFGAMLAAIAAWNSVQ
jgi:hypothetical protein